MKNIIKAVRGIKKALLALFLIVALASFSFAQQSSVCPIAAYEGELVRLSPEAYDPDPEIGPAGKLVWEFGHPFDEQGRWQTTKGKRGVFNFWVSVSDGELKDTKRSCVEVLPNNRNPILQPVPEVFITRGDNIKIPVTCTDPDGDAVEVNYRFQGRDVAYIAYEPPGTYDLQIICTDGFGGFAFENTKLHILMPEIKEKPKPAPVIIEDPGIVEVDIPSAGEVEVVLPPAGDVEVVYPPECPPCPTTEDVDVVVYDSLYTLPETEQPSAQEPAPEPIQEPGLSDCEEDLQRKQEISSTLGCC